MYLRGDGDVPDREHGQRGQHFGPGNGANLANSYRHIRLAYIISSKRTNNERHRQRVVCAIRARAVYKSNKKKKKLLFIPCR